VSTSTQDLALQLDALHAAGCDPARVYQDIGSGTIRHRPQLDAALDWMRPGDTLVVWRLDRLGRSLRHLVMLIGDLEQREIALRSITEAIDTATPAGRLQLHLFAALAQFEAELVRERTRAGLEAARARGRVGGRPPVLTSDKLDAARLMLAGGRTVTATAKALGVHRATLYRRLALDDPVDQKAA